jgi:peptide/nickel transport system substrate-binding protein
MRIGIGVPPGTPSTGSAIVVKLLTSEPWVTNKPDGHQGERIATSWAWDASGTTLRLKLRKDIYFHDGDRLTPDLAAQALRQTQKNARTEAFSFSSVREIVPSGDDAVEIRLSEVNSFVVPDLSAVVVTKPGKPDIATGPFQVVSQSAQESTLSAFPRYYRGPPGVAAIEVRTYPTQRNAWSALMRGDIDMLHEVSRDAAEFVEAESTIQAYRFPRPYYIPIVFNVRHPILRSVAVRRAINEAVDKAALVRDAMNGRGRPANGPIFPQHWAYTGSVAPFEFSPPRAKQRLDEAGLREHAGPGGTANRRFSFTCLVFADDTRFDRLAVIVQKQLSDVGIDMKLEPLPLQQFGKRLQTGDFDAFIFEMAGRSLSWVYEFWRSHEGALNNSGYKSADAVLDRIRGSRTDDEVRAGVAELDRVMHADPPAAFLVWQETSRAVSTKFDVAAEPNRDILTNLWQWRPVTKRDVR